jgi:two-component system NtrC family sensor kinase
VLVVARDIQELRQARKELQAYQDHMARTERLASLGTLSATVAHEMNQPLTVLRLTIQNCLAQLRSDGLSPQAFEDLESCVEEVSAAAAIVGRFRSFARESSKVRMAHVNLHDVTTKVLRLWEEAAREANVTFSLKGLNELPNIYVDERDAEQLVFSLVENAIQASDGRKQHRLAIGGTVNDRAVELAFADDCGGIAPKHVVRLFDPFFTTKDSEHATGLGLCIVERIVSKMGGKIRVDNRPGEGVTFIVTLPVEDAAWRMA